MLRPFLLVRGIPDPEYEQIFGIPPNNFLASWFPESRIFFLCAENCKFRSWPKTPKARNKKQRSKKHIPPIFTRGEYEANIPPKIKKGNMFLFRSGIPPTTRCVFSRGIPDMNKKHIRDPGFPQPGIRYAFFKQNPPSNDSIHTSINLQKLAA